MAVQGCWNVKVGSSLRKGRGLLEPHQGHGEERGEGRSCQLTAPQQKQKDFMLLLERRQKGALHNCLAFHRFCFFFFWQNNSLGQAHLQELCQSQAFEEGGTSCDPLCIVDLLQGRSRSTSGQEQHLPTYPLARCIWNNSARNTYKHYG